MYVCVYVCVYAWMYMHACMYACMHACMYVCIYIRMNIHITSQLVRPRVTIWNNWNFWTLSSIILLYNWSILLLCTRCSKAICFNSFSLQCRYIIFLRYICVFVFCSILLSSRVEKCIIFYRGRDWLKIWDRFRSYLNSKFIINHIDVYFFL